VIYILDESWWLNVLGILVSFFFFVLFGDGVLETHQRSVSVSLTWLRIFLSLWPASFSSLFGRCGDVIGPGLWLSVARWLVDTLLLLLLFCTLAELGLSGRA
jgi:hypothetical protein